MGDALNRGQGRFAPLLLVLLLGALAAGLGASGLTGGAASPPPALDAYPWFYLRDGQPLRPDEPVVELIAVGDVMPGRGVAAGEAPLDAVAPWLQAADLTVGNLEAVLVMQEPAAAPGQEDYLLWAPPAATAMLAGAGFDLLGLANNHSLDAGPAGLEETAAHLHAAGVIPFGAGPGEAAYAPVFREVNGVRLAFLAFTTFTNPEGRSDRELPARMASGDWTPAFWDKPRALAAVQLARAQSDAVIVSLHGGYEYETRPDPAQLRIANELAVAGATLILGHHPHVAQPLAVNAGPPASAVAYSLGNFLFDQEQGHTGEGLALRAFFDADGLRALQALPVAAGSRPHLLAPEEAEALLARVAPPPAQRFFSCSHKGCTEIGEAENPETRPGLPGGEAAFIEGGPSWSGQIDLTGDGRPELVRRAAGQVTIYEGATAVWQSPAEWRIVDVAFGDPNDDGRGELLLALQREDEAGHTRSQPYVVGYRSGAYGLLWGGRAVVAPILEVELGDVDGDGAQELAVLEAREEGASLALWRWQGWTFSLVWRSEPAPYSNLTLVPSGKGLLLRVDEAPSATEPARTNSP